MARVAKVFTLKPHARPSSVSGRSLALAVVSHAVLSVSPLQVCTVNALAQARREKIFLTCSAVIGFSAVPKCCPSASLMSV